MVAYSFQTQFEAPILAGTKRQTLRSPRKRHARVGEEVQIYYGMRTRHCRLIGRATCVHVMNMRLDVEHGRIESLDTGTAWTTPDEVDFFAQSDGFADWRAMERFWTEHHPEAPQWQGVMIRWDKFQAASA